MEAAVGDKRRLEDDCARRRILNAAASRPATSALTDETWSRVHTMVVVAKSLGTITRITLAFFKEQELAQMRQRGLQRPVFPVMVPVSEVYAMMAPRKRRAYDVLHVLEGIGILKRAHDKASMLARFRGGTFLYFGRHGALKRLESIIVRANVIAQTTIAAFPQATRLHIDAALAAACNRQASTEHWPLLASTAVAFLCFLVEPGNGTARLVSRISHRLVDARQPSEGEDSTESRDNLLHDINRRVYDIVNVLVTLNVVILSSQAGEPKRNEVDRRRITSSRNGVAFHHAILSDPTLIRVGDTCSSHLATVLKLGSKNQLAGNVPNSQALQPVTSAAFSKTAEHPRLPKSLDNNVEDLFPEIEISRDCSCDLADWWDAPLRDLLLRDALPPVDFLDWEIMKAISRSRSSARALPTSYGDEEDLLCHEQLRPSC